VTEFIPPGTRFAALPSPFRMKRGGELHGARMAYETWGELSSARDNAVLILTGLSPSAHAAASPADPEPGWWEAMVGAGKPIDSNRWFVVCVNSLGSCKGSTGPASQNPATGEPYRLEFPELSVEDGANAAFEVLKSLGIGRLACVIGNSMGGMTALALLKLHPGAARAHINVSGSARALPEMLTWPRADPGCRSRKASAHMPPMEFPITQASRSMPSARTTDIAASATSSSASSGNSSR
jgi:homoserine O-acetyltransferase